MASSNIIGTALLGAALTLTYPLKAQEANEDFLSPEVMELAGETKNYVAIINGGRIDTYTVSSERFIGGKPECRNVEGWGETYILKGKQNIEVLVNDNPLDPVKLSKLTYQKGGRTGDCNETDGVCVESAQEFANRIKILTTSPICGDNQIAKN